MIAGANVQHGGIEPPISDPVIHAAMLASLALYIAGDEQPSLNAWAAAARARQSGADSPWQPGTGAWARAERPR